jgi:hypothetical protein
MNLVKAVLKKVQLFFITKKGGYHEKVTDTFFNSTFGDIMYRSNR